MGKQDRMKASDVFREAQLLFVDKVPFNEAFPQIQYIEIEVQETGRGLYHGSSGHRVYKTPHMPGEYINCGNPLCYNGGFSIGKVIRETVRNKETATEGSASCQGYEGSPKGRRKYRPCFNHFTYRIKIQYKDEAPSAPPIYPQSTP